MNNWIIFFFFVFLVFDYFINLDIFGIFFFLII